MTGEEPVTPVRHEEVRSLLRTLKRHTPATLKKVLRSAVREHAVRTANQRVLPNFLIVGTKRGGTTSLWNWLSRHPAVMPMHPAVQQIKSPHYFDINFDRGPDWYRSHFPAQWTVDRLAQRLGCPPGIGEASPYYMFHPQAPARISELVPDVKLVILLRDPVKRAYSNYWERLGSGAETLPTFREAIDAEPERLRGEVERLEADSSYYSAHHDNHSYLARGRYLEQLERIYRYFPEDQVLVLRSEDLYADPRAASTQVQQFLGLPVHDIDRLEHHNKLRVPPLDMDLEEQLRAHFDPLNQALYARLGVDLAWPERRT